MSLKQLLNDHEGGGQFPACVAGCQRHAMQPMRYSIVPTSAASVSRPMPIKDAYSVSFELREARERERERRAPVEEDRGGRVK